MRAPHMYGAVLAVATAFVGLSARAENAGPHIREFLPRPFDGDEWIELQVDTGATLAGWMLDDGAGGSKPFSLSVLRPDAAGVLLVTRATSGIALNDDGDAVRLIGPDGAVRETVRYKRSVQGSSYARIGERWKWTDAPTPGAVNPLPAVARAAPNGTSGTHATATAPRAATEYTVVLPTGIIGTRTFAMTDAAGDGVLVRAFGSTDLPAFASGDRVRVREKDGGKLHGVALVTTTGGGVERIGAGDAVRFVARQIAELGATDAGRAVEIRGDVTHAGTKELRITDARGSQEVTVMRPRGDVRKWKEGERISASGVLLFKGGVLTLAALTIEQTAASGESGAVDRVPQTFETPPTTMDWRPFAAIAGVIALSAAGWRVFRARKLAAADTAFLQTIEVEEFEEQG